MKFLFGGILIPRLRDESRQLVVARWFNGLKKHVPRRACSSSFSAGRDMEKTIGFHQAPKNRAIRGTYAASPSRCLFLHEITDISTGIGICIVAIKHPLRHAMGQLPDSGDAFVISRSRSCNSPSTSTPILSPPPRLYLACASPPLFDPNITRELLRIYVLELSGEPSIYARLAFPRRKLFLKRDSLTQPPPNCISNLDVHAAWDSRNCRL